MAEPARAARPLVACLCAAWCGSCRDYRAIFDALAARHAGAADFAWVDIEDDSDALADPDIENFPTLLVADGGSGLFLGAVTPQPAAAERLVQLALAGGLDTAATVDDRALADRVRRLLDRRGA